MATSSFFLLKPEGQRQRPSVYKRCAILLLCDNECVRFASCVASRPPRTVVRWLVMATKAVQVPDSVCGHNKSLFMSQTEQLTSPDCVFSVPGWCLQRWRLTNVGLTFLQLSGNHQCFRKRSIGFTDMFHEANLWKGGQHLSLMWRKQVRRTCGTLGRRAEHGANDQHQTFSEKDQPVTLFLPE